jgi:hypothetical protein
MKLSALTSRGLYPAKLAIIVIATVVTPYAIAQQADVRPTLLNQSSNPVQELILYTDAKDYRTSVPGSVVVAAIINSQGQAMNVHVIHGIGGGFDMKAVELVHQDKFTAATKNGTPATVSVYVRVTFPAASQPQ